MSHPDRHPIPPDPQRGIRALRRIVALLDANAPQAAFDLARETIVSGDATPLLPDLCELAGVAAHALGKFTVAESMWRHAVDADPEQAAAWLHLGELLAAQGRHDDAIACHRTALALQPDRAAAWDRLGLLLMRLLQPWEAEPCHRRAVELTPLDPAPHTHLGFALEALSRHEEALESHQRALACQPDHASIHTNLGNVLAFLDRTTAAEFHHRRAIELAPTFAAACGNLGVLLADQKRDAEAEPLLRRAIALRPDYLLARLNLGFLLLSQGRYAEGWPLHEARHDPALIGHGIPPPPWPIAAWQGEPLAGRSVLVWAEQGFGDQIQFCRYAPLLKAHGAGRVTLVCQRPLLELFRSLAGIDELVAADVVDNAFTTGEVDLSGHDVWTFPLTLPLHLKTGLDNIPSTIPYLRAPPGPATGPRAGPPEAFAENLVHHPGKVSHLKALRERRGEGLSVGLVWRGNPKHHNDAERSLPGLATLAPLWSLPGVRFVSLQTGPAAAEGRAPPVGQPLPHVELADFAATAQALVGLDLLVCVDTSIAHLAGALGVPCWVLLPEHRTDWRWLRERSDSPWYPGSMRLFRQRRRGDWAEVVARVGQALRERVQPPASPR